MMDFKSRTDLSRRADERRLQVMRTP